MNYCQTCNAPRHATLAQVIRCGTCVFLEGKPPTNYRAIEAAHGIKGDA